MFNFIFANQNTNVNPRDVHSLQLYILILTFYKPKFSLILLFVPFFCFTFVNRKKTGIFAPSLT